MNDMLVGLWRDSKGSVAMVFALTSLIVFASVGLAIDFGRAVHARSQLQSAADAAALAAATKSNLGEDARIELATTVFQANVSGSNLVAGTAPVIEVVGSGDTQAIEVRAGADVTTTFSGVAGVSSMPVSVEFDCSSRLDRQ